MAKKSDDYRGRGFCRRLCLFLKLSINNLLFTKYEITLNFKRHVDNTKPSNLPFFLLFDSRDDFLKSV